MGRIMNRKTINRVKKYPVTKGIQYLRKMNSQIFEDANTKAFVLGDGTKHSSSWSLRYSANYKGKIISVDPIYTKWNGRCPVRTKLIRRRAEDYEPEISKDTNIIVIAHKAHTPVWKFIAKVRKPHTCVYVACLTCCNKGLRIPYTIKEDWQLAIYLGTKHNGRSNPF